MVRNMLRDRGVVPTRAKPATLRKIKAILLVSGQRLDHVAFIMHLSKKVAGQQLQHPLFNMAPSPATPQPGTGVQSLPPLVPTQPPVKKTATRLSLNMQ